MTRRPPGRARPRGPLAGRRALRGRGRARSPTAATASSGCPSRESTRWSSSGTRCRASGWSSRSPRAPTATGSGAATPSRCSTASPDRVDGALPVRRPGALRRLRLPARRAARAARPQGRRGARAAASGWPASTSTGRRSRPVARRRRRPALAHPHAVRRAPDGRRGHAQAPLARRRPGRRLPDRRTRRPHAEPGAADRPRPCADRDFAVERRRLLAGAPRARRRCWSRRCSTCSTRSRGSGCSTSTPGSGSSPASSPTRSATGSRLVAVEGDRAAARHARANLAGHQGAVVERGRVDRVLASSYDEPFDLVVLDPPREGAKRAGRGAGRRPGPARGRVRRLRPGRAGPRRGDLRRARLPARARCGPSTCSR